MKLLDPFAGYRLASGHPVVHVALFLGSFVVGLYNEDFPVGQQDLNTAFEVLRWGHFVQIVLALVEAYANSSSEFVEPKQLLPEDGEEPNELRERQELENMKVVNRDGSWRLLSRFCSTISVFAYQGSVFYAQFVLSNFIFYKTAGGDVDLHEIEGARTAWLLLETVAFYLYVLSTVFYIMWRQMISVVWRDSQATSDMEKAISDFIEYASINLTWFAINVQTCVLPILILHCFPD